MVSFYVLSVVLEIDDEDSLLLFICNQDVPRYFVDVMRNVLVGQIVETLAVYIFRSRILLTVEFKILINPFFYCVA